MDVLFYTVDSPEQFWAELGEIADGNYYSATNIQQALTVYIRFAALYTDKYLVEDEDLARCAHLLLKSRIFSSNRAYARRKLINFLADDEIEESNAVAQKIFVGGVLLVDGRAHKSTLEMMQEEAAMNCVVETLWQDRHANARLHRIFLELLYEMCRIQRILDLDNFRPEFIDFLFEAIETAYVSPKSSDPYNTAALMALCALNEQFMISRLVDTPKNQQQQANTKVQSSSPNAHHNLVFESLSKGKRKFKTFGENLVFMFNRGADNCLQLMMLKLLYLIFTTPETYDYFYLNDVKVLVDVFLRELDNLPREEEMLRNSYLRVLCPMLSNTATLAVEQYKRRDLIQLLEYLVYPAGPALITETTQRLAYRCLKIEWIDCESPEITPITSRSSSASSEAVSLNSTISGTLVTPTQSCSRVATNDNTHSHHHPHPPNIEVTVSKCTKDTGSPTPPPPRKLKHGSNSSHRNGLKVPHSTDIRSSSVVDIASTLAERPSIDSLIGVSRSKSPRPAPPPPRKHTPTPIPDTKVGVSWC